MPADARRVADVGRAAVPLVLALWACAMTARLRRLWCWMREYHMGEIVEVDGWTFARCSTCHVPVDPS